MGILDTGIEEYKIHVGNIDQYFGAMGSEEITEEEIHCILSKFINKKSMKKYQKLIMTCSIIHRKINVRYVMIQMATWLRKMPTHI